MHEHLRHLSANATMPISCLPNMGLPSVVDGKMHYDLTPEEFVEYQTRFVTELGVQVVGGCCGSTPEHLRQLAAVAKDLTPGAPRAPARGRRRVDVQRRAVPPGRQLPHHRRAHQRQRLQEVPRG